MASFGRTRRAQSGFVRPLAVLFALSTLLLLGRNTDPVRAAATFGTELLVPVQRVLADAGIAVSSFTQAVSEIQTLRDDNTSLRSEVDRLTIENVRLREAAVAAQQAAKLSDVAKTIPFESVPATVIADPADCTFQLDLTGGAHQFSTSCDIAKGALTNAGVAYSTRPGPSAQLGSRAARSSTSSSPATRRPRSARRSSPRSTGSDGTG